MLLLLLLLSHILSPTTATPTAFCEPSKAHVFPEKLTRRKIKVNPVTGEQTFYETSNTSPEQGKTITSNPVCHFSDPNSSHTPSPPHPFPKTVFSTNPWSPWPTLRLLNFPTTYDVGTRSSSRTWRVTGQCWGGNAKILPVNSPTVK